MLARTGHLMLKQAVYLPLGFPHYLWQWLGDSKWKRERDTHSPVCSLRINRAQDAWLGSPRHDALNVDAQVKMAAAQQLLLTCLLAGSCYSVRSVLLGSGSAVRQTPTSYYVPFQTVGADYLQAGDKR